MTCLQRQLGPKNWNPVLRFLTAELHSVTESGFPAAENPRSLVCCPSQRAGGLPVATYQIPFLLESSGHRRSSPLTEAWSGPSAPILSELLVVLRAIKLSDWGLGESFLAACLQQLTDQQQQTFFASQYENWMVNRWWAICEHVPTNAKCSELVDNRSLESSSQRRCS